MFLVKEIVSSYKFSTSLKQKNQIQKRNGEEMKYLVEETLKISREIEADSVEEAEEIYIEEWDYEYLVEAAQECYSTTPPEINVIELE